MIFEGLQDFARYKIRGNAGYSEEFQLKRGLKEGCPASPQLFNLYHNQVLRNYEDRARTAEIEGAKVATTNKMKSYRERRKKIPSIAEEIRAVLFADDTNIFVRHSQKRKSRGDTGTSV